MTKNFPCLLNGFIKEETSFKSRRKLESRKVSAKGPSRTKDRCETTIQGPRYVL